MIHSNKKGWIVLAAYMGIVAVTQMLWLNFAPITNDVMNQYHCSEFLAGMLTIIFPLVYVIISLPSGILIDRYGYKKVIVYSGLLMVVSAALRQVNHQYMWLLIGQLGISIAQPFIFNSISKLVADWFNEQQAALATGLGTVGIFLGMIIGLGLSPWLATSYSINTMLTVFTVISLVAWLAFIIFASESPVAKTRVSTKVTINTITRLCKNPQLFLLFMLSFLAIGTFNTIMTWMQPMLAPNGITENQAGMIGAMLICAGVVGAIIFPALSDKLKRRRPFIIIACSAAVVLYYPLVSGHAYSSLLMAGGLMGFFFLPGYALLLTMTEELAGSQLSGTATSLLMLMGNAGGVIFSIAAESINATTHNWLLANAMMFALLLISLLLMVVKLKEPFTAG